MRHFESGIWLHSSRKGSQFPTMQSMSVANSPSKSIQLDARNVPSMNEKIITGFSAVRLFVSDLGRAIDFYGDTLGLQLTARDESVYAIFQLPNVMLLVERVEPGGAQD